MEQAPQETQAPTAPTEARKSQDLLDGINTREELEEKLFLARQPPPPRPEPDAPTMRQVANREREMAAGKRALERHLENYKHRGPPERSPSEIAAEGTSSPVKVDDAFVPNMDQGKNGARAQSRSIR